MQVLDKLENKTLTIGSATVTVSLLEGEEEDEYIVKAEGHMNTKAQHFKGNRGRGRGRGRGGRGRGNFRGHKRAGSPDEHNRKKVKQESADD